jgi:hypothetical protein
MWTMGRPRKKDKHLPPCVFKQHGAYYYVKGGVWERIGTSLVEVHRFYANKLTEPKGGLNPLIDAAFERMKGRVAEPLSPKTIAQYALAAKRLKHLLREFSSNCSSEAEGCGAGKDTSRFNTEHG